MHEARLGFPDKRLIKIPKSFTVGLSSFLSQRDLEPFTIVTVHWKKGNYEIFWGLSKTGSELTPIPRNTVTPQLK